MTILYSNGKMKTMEEWKKEYLEDHQIKCPYCGYVLEGEEVYPYVSMWAEDSDDRCECTECEKVFAVEEEVDRTWTVTKIERT